jgi:hypothetical protein
MKLFANHPPTSLQLREWLVVCPAAIIATFSSRILPQAAFYSSISFIVSTFIFLGSISSRPYCFINLLNVVFPRIPSGNESFYVKNELFC